jgi:hypothetical protein
MEDQERYDSLRRGLAGPNMDLYQQSADFRYAVDQMAQWLPEIMDLMADGARWRQERFAERLHAARYAPVKPMIVSPEQAGGLGE